MSVLYMLAIVFLCLFLLLLFVIHSKGSYVTSTSGETYYVLDRDDKQQAADKLSKLNTTIESIINGMSYRYPGDKAVIRLKQRYRGVLTERDPINPITGTTYNKGEEIVIAIRRPTGGFITDNRLLYITLHELAHIMTEGYDQHGEEFRRNHQRLLNYAISQRLYKPEAGTLFI